MERKAIVSIMTLAGLALTLCGCGAGSARDANEVQEPKLEGGRMGLSPEERIKKIQESNMTDADKQARIAKINAEAGGAAGK